MRKEVKAVLTIEAAVIVPLSMIIITMLVCFGLYLHDVVLADTVGPAAVLEAAGQFDSSEYDIKTEVREMLERRLSAAGVISVDCEGEEDKKICVKGSFSWPFQSLISSPGLSGISSELSLTNLDGRSQLLKYKMLCDGIADLTGSLGEDGD